MKILAVRDRMLDYYLPPFVVESIHQALAGLAGTINNPENMNAIAQTPHHFELWELGEVNEETGDLTAKRQLICDCTSLVRAGVREGADSRSGTGASKTGVSGRQGAPGRLGGHSDAQAGTPAHQARTTPGEGPEVRPGPGGVPSN